MNLVGVMGKGLAKQTANRWPGCVAPYRRACQTGSLRRGRILPWQRPDGGWVLQTPTKEHWRNPSTISLVAQSVRELVRSAEELKLKRIGIPPLGCGLGGLDWPAVRELIVAAAEDSPVEVAVYGKPAGTPTGK